MPPTSIQVIDEHAARQFDAAQAAAKKRRARAPREEVDLMPSGYEWVCEKCGTLNKEIEIPRSAIVTCKGTGKRGGKCAKRYAVSIYDVPHCYGSGR